MAEKSVVVVFTYKDTDHIIRDGGTSSWRLHRTHGKHCKFVVCTRNAKNKRVEGTEEHRSAFLVGKVSDVVLSPKYEDRYLIQISEYAKVSVPDVWEKGDRNPVHYADSLEELGIDPNTLKWEPMPAPSESAQPTLKSLHSSAHPLTMAEAKNGLALTFGVAPEAIEITIRG